jgi:hypothetical protein
MGLSLASIVGYSRDEKTRRAGISCGLEALAVRRLMLSKKTQKERRESLV